MSFCHLSMAAALQICFLSYGVIGIHNRYPLPYSFLFCAQNYLFCKMFSVANEKTDGSGSAEQEAESHDWEKELHDELQVCIV